MENKNIEIIGAGQGFTTPPFPDVGGLEARGEFFYLLSFGALVLTFIAVRAIYSTRFKLILNAIRDNEDTNIRTDEHTNTIA